VNVVEMVQDAPAASELPQVVVRAKSPLTETPLMATATVPGLLTVTVCAALVVPTFWVPKVRLGVLMFSWPTGAELVEADGLAEVDGLGDADEDGGGLGVPVCVPLQFGAGQLPVQAGGLAYQPELVPVWVIWNEGPTQLWIGLLCAMPVAVTLLKVTWLAACTCNA
jgi:hypothetical protein